ncbi:hypothetical protein [Nostoc sp. 'Peltigera malacea cyanobiont' DB3992]|nr:hypothetical protein [Nostoc sp. 'Peltigera malacea cyanobiont' DB3992]
MSLTEEILSQLPGDVLGGLRQGDRISENGGVKLVGFTGVTSEA